MLITRDDERKAEKAVETTFVTSSDLRSQAQTPSFCQTFTDNCVFLSERYKSCLLWLLL